MSNLLHVGLILIISKVFTILCLLCLCSNREYPGKFENKISNECPCKVRGKTFLKWTRSIDLSSELHLYLYNCIRDTATYSSNVNYYKSVDHPIPTLPVGTGGSTLAIFKSISKLLSIEFPDMFSSCPNWRGKKSLFWKGARRGTTLQDYHLVNVRDKKVSLFLKFEIFLPLLCFLLYLLTK